MPRNVEQHECPVRYSILMLKASMIPVMDGISYSKKKTYPMELVVHEDQPRLVSNWWPMVFVVR